MGFAHIRHIFPPAERMADRYKIYEKLGAGGVGAVYRAYDSQLKRWVAVKRLLSANEAAQDKTIEAELRREADTLASLRNPNVVTIFDVASDAEGLFMVMELLQGEDLADVVARGPLPYDDFKELASQTLEGLLAAHQHHILHRDIKPENIKVERLPGGRMQSKIIDFGLARAGLRARKQTEDQEGTVMGSIFYMAPEQLTREPVDERTDLYSLGCVFYEALSGKKAFDGESMNQVIDKHINHDIIPLHVVAPHVPAWLGAWCMRLMAQKPEDRPLSAQQAIEEFRAWEKVPTMVPYMPWMGMYPGYGQPMMYPGTGTAPVPGTGSVPVGTGYFPVAEQPQQIEPEYYAQPVEVIPEAVAVTEVAAITTPLAPAPQRPAPRSPGTGSVTPAKRGLPAKMHAGGSGAGGGIKWALIGGGVLVAALAAWFFLRSSGGKGGGESEPGGGGMLSGLTDTQPPKVSFQLPQERLYPPADRNISLFYVVNAGVLSSRKTADGKPAPANLNENVLEWRDLAERGDDNILRAPSGNAGNGPKLVEWPVAKTGSGPKQGRRALDFRARNGKPAALQLVDPKEQAGKLPFGNEPVLGDPGLSIVAVTQADATALPVRMLGMSNDQGGSIVMRVDAQKNIVAELKQGSATARIISKDVNGTMPCVWALLWNANGNVELRARDSDGRAFTGTARTDAPKSPLIRASVGRLVGVDGQGDAPAAEQFSGYLAELVIYSSVLKLDQIQLLESRLRDYHIQAPPPSPLKQRLKSKLEWIEPRSEWKLKASHRAGDAAKATDDSQSTRWATGAPMKGGEWFSIELPSETDIAGLVLDSQGNPQDYARKFKIELSMDGRSWGPPVVTQDGRTPLIEVIFPAAQRARHVRVTQLGGAGNNWGMQEIVLLKK
jgi:hypothetical protein